MYELPNKWKTVAYLDEPQSPDLREDAPFKYYVRHLRKFIRKRRRVNVGQIVRGGGLRDHYRITLALEELQGRGEVAQGGPVLAPTYSVIRGKR